MEQPAIHKTYGYKLNPTSQQERMLERALMLCRHIYNAAIGERRQAWRMCRVSVTYYQQKAQLPGIKEAMPEFADVHSQVLQDVVLRVDRAFQAFFRRMQEGQTPGYPRFHGRDRYNSFTYPQYGNGATLDGGVLSLSKIGRILIRLHRQLEGPPKTVTISRDGWYACFSCADVPAQPLPMTGQETGVDLGIEAFATVSDGTRIFSPSWHRKAERAQKTHSGEYHVVRTVAIVAGRRSRYWRKRIRKYAASGRTFITRRRSNSFNRTTPSIMRTCRSAICSGATISPRASKMPGGRRS
jgi:putative transposase